jgi:hypothetical protein
MSAQPAGSTPLSVKEHATNIRRNLRKAHGLLNIGNDRDSHLVDLINHMDTIAQQIESET